MELIKDKEVLILGHIRVRLGLVLRVRVSIGLFGDVNHVTYGPALWDFSLLLHSPIVLEWIGPIGLNYYRPIFCSMQKGSGDKIGLQATRLQAYKFTTN